jgi:photosystem II stability/assembly factor-like uncharacterized protein
MSLAVRPVAPRAVGTLAFLALAASAAAQSPTAAPLVNQSADPVLRPFAFRSIGPASMGGRIDDIAVSASNPDIIYLGYAAGGVFRSLNNGTTFEPVFQRYPTASIGAIAIDPHDPEVVYVGTGEANNRQTSSFGDGIYKTTDGGRTFRHLGLTGTQTIARIVIDPRDTRVVYVASPGHLFGPSTAGGIYKSADGGATWTRIKAVDQYTGFTDLALDPANPNVLYAASYQRERSGCCFNGGGPGSGLWKSTDAGRTWTRLSGHGLPTGTYGRIALGVARSQPNIVYAQIEVGESDTPMYPGELTEGAPGERAAFDWCNNGGPEHGFARGGRGGTRATPPALDPAASGVFRSDDSGRNWRLVSNCNARPMYFSQLRVDPSNPNTIYVAGLPVAKSLDGGRTFATLDAAGGNHSPAHVDQHAIWVDPHDPGHLMIGNDGGLDVSYDQGDNWQFVNTMATSLAYWVTADMRHPYDVYVGLQDNGSWGGPSTTRSRNGILNSDWFGIGGGDGFQTAVDPDDYHIVYSESQNGFANRYDLRTGQSSSIRPNAGPPPAPPTGATCADGRAAGVAPPGPAVNARARVNVLNAAPGDRYRFNWNTPLMLSPNNPDIVWMGGNRLFKSYDRGNTWVASPDLTKQIDRCTVAMMGVAGDRTQLSKNDGVAAYGTITAISESPVMPGVVWAGTDDGNLQVSQDGGRTFSEVAPNLPGLPAGNLYWISRIDASHFDAATAYVSVDGHRSDDMHPYVFVTHDYGHTFRSLSANLPAYGDVQVVRQDPRNRDLLFVGTEFGLYASLDGGQSWNRFMNGYPTVRTDDILIHPRDGDLIVATHGRGVWVADDITPLEQFTPEVASQDVHLFDVRPAIAYQNDLQAGQHVGGQQVFVGENAPAGTAISYYLKSAGSRATLTITDAMGKVVRTLDATADAGINRVQWNLEPDAAATGQERGAGGRPRVLPPVAPGTYRVTLMVDGKTYDTSVEVLKDVWMDQR